MTILLAVLVPIFWAAVAHAQQQAPAAGVSLNFGNMVVEVVGKGWKLHYGSMLDPGHAYDTVKGGLESITRLADAGNGKVWFSHGGWLRLIDAKAGVVLGRWHFTDVISKLEPKGEAVVVTYRMQADMRRSTVAQQEITPDTRSTRFVNPNNYRLVRLAQIEAERTGEFSFSSTLAQLGKRPVEQTQKLLPAYEEMARRDPFSPFLQAAYGTLLMEKRDPRSREALRKAATMPTADYTELWPIAAYLEGLGETELGAVAFERGYRDYLERGNDPRMHYIILSRLVFYRPPEAKDFAAKKEILERFYRIAPYLEGSQVAWQAWAKELELRGDPSAAMWRTRAEESRRQEMNWSLRQMDWWILLSSGSLAAGLLFVIAQWIRYWPQVRLDRAKEPERAYFTNMLRMFSYWTRRERYALVLIVAVAWYSQGVLNRLGATTVRIWGVPVNQWMGNLASPQTREALERLPETSGRNLLLALAYQQAGDPERAMRVYLGQPQYAEAWNNLGVIYLERGEGAKANEAFQRALQIDPELHEARLNLGQATRDFWTKQYRELVPGRPMLAPPKAEQIKEAYLGMSPAGVYLKALTGPLTGRPRDFAAIVSEFHVPLPLIWLGVLLGALSLILIFILPLREVTEAPPRWYRWVEVILPGTARSWRWAGALAMVIWGAFLMGLLFLATVGSTFMLTTLAMMNITRAYQVKVDLQEAVKMQTGAEYWWILPAIVFLINVVLLRRGFLAAARAPAAAS